MLELSLPAARMLTLIKQGLTTRPKSVARATLLETIQRIGLLQLDSVSTVERSHYLALFSRVGPYDRVLMDELVYPDAAVVERWTHCASLIPREDFSHFAPAALERRNSTLNPRRLSALGDVPEQTLEAVYARVAEEGPLMARDFAEQVNGPKEWWNRKPSRVALEELTLQGRLIVERRVNFQCSYNLQERVVPEALAAEGKPIETLYTWVTERSLQCMGVATAAHIADYYRQPIKAVRTVLKTAVTEGRITPVTVTGWKQQAYVHAIDMALAKECVERAGHMAGNGGEETALSVTTLLSPFDNLIWHRDRTRDLFGFAYKNEMYTPVKQRERVHGYYVMPILLNGSLVGRVDPKVDRKNKQLCIQKAGFEEDFIATEAACARIGQSIIELMQFTGCQSIAWTCTRRSKAHTGVKNYLSEQGVRGKKR